MEKTKKEEPEFVSMGVATPTTGFDTIKRAEMRVADTDTYKGRVLKMPEDEQVSSQHVSCFLYILGDLEA